MGKTIIQIPELREVMERCTAEQPRKTAEERRAEVRQAITEQMTRLYNAGSLEAELIPLYIAS